MSSKIYFYDTIEECEKEIVDKTIIMDINHTSNLNLFECFVRLIRTIIIWTNIICTGITFFNYGFKSGIKIFGIFIAIHIVWALLVSWVNYNYTEYYIKSKIRLVNNILNGCKEWQENDYEEWQQKQMIKRFEIMAHLNNQ